MTLLCGHRVLAVSVHSHTRIGIHTSALRREHVRLSPATYEDARAVALDHSLFHC